MALLEAICHHWRVALRSLKRLKLFSVCSLSCLQLEMGAISSHSTACLLPAVSVLTSWTLVSLELYASNKST